jgi:hypothetical protein
VRRIFHDCARNAMVEEFLESDAECIWFLDSDIAPAHNVPDLVTEHWDKWMCAGAPYPDFMTPPGGNQQEVDFTVYSENSEKGLCPSKVPYSGTAFVAGLATGCLFLKRELFAKLQKPYFEFTYDPETRAIKQGEDLGFCKKVNALGYQFFVDFGMTCKHYKTVCLLDVNEYAIAFAARAVANHDAALRQNIAALQDKISQRKARASLALGPQPSGQTSQQTQGQSALVLPGHGSPFAQGNGRIWRP